MTAVRILTVLATAFLSAACSTSPVSTTDAHRVNALRWGNQTPGSGTLLVKRDTGFMGGGCKATVLIDRQEVVRLAPGEMVTLYLPPGEHMAAAKNGGLCGGAISEAAISIAAGQQVNYRIEILDAGGIRIQPTAF